MTTDSKYSVYHRARVLSLIDKYGPLTYSQLSKHLNVSRPAVYQYIDWLKKHDLIFLDKDISKKGAPVFIKLTSKANPVKLELLDNSHDIYLKITSVFRGSPSNTVDESSNNTTKP